MRRIILMGVIILTCLLMIPTQSEAQEQPEFDKKIVISGEAIGSITIDIKATKKQATIPTYEMKVYEKVLGQWREAGTYTVTRAPYGKDAEPGTYGRNGELAPTIVSVNSCYNAKKVKPGPHLSENHTKVLLISDKYMGYTVKTGDVTRDWLYFHKGGGQQMLGCIGVLGGQQVWDKFIDSFTDSDVIKVEIEPSGIDLLQLNISTSSVDKLPSVIKERIKLKLLGGVDFTSIRFNYISAGESGFLKLVINGTGAEEGENILNVESALDNAVDSFFIGLTLPDEKFWVNLNPWEPERVVDDDVGTTDVGRIMLEADLQMKRDFCKYKNPGESDIGTGYWDLLDKKQEELVVACMNEYPDEISDADSILFQSVTRHWIVPDEVTAYGDDNEIHISKATLDIFSEPVYEHSTFRTINLPISSLSEACLECVRNAAKEYGRYAMEIEEELILPLVVEEINNREQYSDLRQVYVSLALAQWYKSRFADTSMLSDIIDSGDPAGLESEDSWSPVEIWEEYVKSYEEGEFRYEKKETYEEGDYIITETRIYTGGGVDFADITNEVSILGKVPEETRDIFIEAQNVPFKNVGNEYYIADYLFAGLTASAIDGEQTGGEPLSEAVLPESPEKEDGHGEDSDNQSISSEPEKNGSICGFLSDGTERTTSSVFVLMIGIPLTIGLVKYFRKGRRF